MGALDSTALHENVEGATGGEKEKGKEKENVAHIWSFFISLPVSSHFSPCSFFFILAPCLHLDQIGREM